MVLQEKARTRMVKQETSGTRSSWSEVWASSPPRDDQSNGGNGTTRRSIFFFFVTELQHLKKTQSSIRSYLVEKKNWLFLTLCGDRWGSIGEGQESGSCCQAVAGVLQARCGQASNAQASGGSGQQGLVVVVHGTERYLAMLV